MMQTKMQIINQPKAFVGEYEVTVGVIEDGLVWVAGRDAEGVKLWRVGVDEVKIMSHAVLV